MLKRMLVMASLLHPIVCRAVAAGDRLNGVDRCAFGGPKGDGTPPEWGLLHTWGGERAGGAVSCRCETGLGLPHDNHMTSEQLIDFVTPTLSHGKLYVRTPEHLICYQVARAAGSTSPR